MYKTQIRKIEQGFLLPGHKASRQTKGKAGNFSSNQYLDMVYTRDSRSPE